VERTWRLQLLYLPPLDIPRDGKDQKKEDRERGERYGLLIV
jgi:hypothetical protein